MADTDQSIRPALTPEEWARIAAGDGLDGHGIAVDDLGMIRDADDLAAAVAYANDRLPSSDPRKIRQEMVDNMLAIATDYAGRSPDHQERADALRLYAVTLAALLPPA